MAALLLSGCDAEGGGKSAAPSATPSAAATGASAGGAANPGTSVPAQLLMATDAVKAIDQGAAIQEDKAGTYPIAKLCKPLRAEPYQHTSHRRLWTAGTFTLVLTGHSFTKAEDAQLVQSAKSVADTCDRWNTNEGDFYKILGPAKVPDGVADYSSHYGICYETAMEGAPDESVYCMVWLVSGSNALTVEVSGPDAKQPFLEELLAKVLIPASKTLVSAPGSQKA
ncbi:hypothetical protein [Virgisporangium aliadipatigenens]|uniref:hypothetical protein n=1 Tax=Virgisporangium aliadipatigenens TaxID=741659 RepID=UPI001940D59A|nr:hypothetical protein [Virgisporangium aliadipatigenens]